MLRVTTLALILAFTLWFSFGQDSSAEALSQRTADLFDNRPVRSILIIGNSRTFYNDMPKMVRSLAVSSNSKVNLEIETVTAAGASFENHWANMRARRLLAAGWDEVILQGESGAQSSSEQNVSFQRYGARIGAIAKVKEGRPTLLVNWPYDRSVFKDYEPYDRSEHLSYLREIHASLASDAGLDRLNLAGLWESVKLANPSLKLTTDGNHPTPAGSYIYALAVYAYATGEPVSALDYVPEGIDEEEAAALRASVDAYPLAI